MRGYFDEDEPEPERPRRDTELTLGTGALVGLVSALLLVCGLCFAAGYAVGHHGSAPSASNAPTPAPDQEPLQANDSIPKPSASEQPPAPAPQTDDSPTNPEPGAGANPTTTEQSPGNSEPGGSSTGSPAAKAPASAQPAQPVLPATGNTAPAAQAPNVHAALPAPTQFMVQIAAVANPEDADVLVTALRKRGYSVTATREPADQLIHVRIGPFNSRDEANHWRDKLLGDGYNAVVQP
jgi:cell division protein FtsN